MPLATAPVRALFVRKKGLVLSLGLRGDEEYLARDEGVWKQTASKENTNMDWNLRTSRGMGQQGSFVSPEVTRIEFTELTGEEVIACRSHGGEGGIAD